MTLIPAVGTLPNHLCPCGELHDDWPGNGQEKLCQMCWEAQCAESFWSYWGREDETQEVRG
jgi:hypothetical protein